MSQKLRFKRIKNLRAENGTGKVIALEWQERSKTGEWGTFTLELDEEAKPGFYKAMVNLTPFIHELCELSASINGRVTVNGIALHYSGDKDIMGVKILSTLSLQKHPGCVSINTPYLAESLKKEDDSEKAKASLLPAECLETIKSLIKEAADYVSGKRLTVKIPGVDGKTAAAGPDA